VGHQVDLIAGVNAGKTVDTRLRGGNAWVADPIAIHIESAIAIADAECIGLTHTIVHVITNAIIVCIGRT
jgi:hypothetical protein